MEYPIVHPCFFTATIYQWKQLLKPTKYKQIIVDSLSYLVQKQRVIVYGFVIMDNHIHLLWQMQADSDQKDVQRDFLKFTAQMIKFDLQKHHPAVLKQFYVGLRDRKFQFWQRNALSVELFTPSVFDQKLDYIHDNPVKAGMCEFPEDYVFSSARYYISNELNFDFLSHYV